MSWPALLVVAILFAALAVLADVLDRPITSAAMLAAWLILLCTASICRAIEKGHDR